MMQKITYNEIHIGKHTGWWPATAVNDFFFFFFEHRLAFELLSDSDSCLEQRSKRQKDVK
jgi:hypothetical protein